MIKDLMIGSDPEVFLINESGFVSSEGKFGGTKEEPKELERKGFFIQEDNVMVEFNIPPAKNLQELTDNIKYMLDYISVAAQQYDCVVSNECSARFNINQLNTEQAQTFGCDPDFNVYTMERNPSVNIELNPTLRTCGGHIHIGYKDPSPEISAILIKALDVTLGLPSLLRDKDRERRKFYGNAGAFRIKSFGVEYRTLSNFWIFSDSDIKWVYEGVQNAVNLVNSKEFFDIFSNKEFSIVEEVINSGDQRKAFELIEKISEIFKTKKTCVDY